MPSISRTILEIKPGRTWLVVVDGDWAVDAPPHNMRVPLAQSAGWLLPLLEVPRHQVEERASGRLEVNDPDLDVALRSMIEKGLMASDYWIPLVLRWMTAPEVEFFTPRLHVIAIAHAGASQATQHAAKRLLKQHGLWAPADL